MEINYQSDIGQVRQKNDDSVGAFINQGNQELVVIADGLGAYQGGDIASSLAVNNLGQAFLGTNFSNTNEAIVWLDRLIYQQNTEILAKADAKLELLGMGSTLVGFLFFKEQVVIFNLGDSPAYCFKSQNLEKLSCDHTLVAELVRLGQISLSAAKTHKKRNILTRSLGFNQRCKVDYLVQSLVSEATYLICSDGLTKMLSEAEIANILKKPLSLADKVQELIKAANDKGGRDNITLALAQKETKVRK